MLQACRLLAIGSLAGLLLACGAPKDSEGSADDGDLQGVFTGLLERAKGMLASDDAPSGAGRSTSGSSSSAIVSDPIVRCEEDGSVRFTNQSMCQSGGERMALKAKNEN